MADRGTVWIAYKTQNRVVQVDAGQRRSSSAIFTTPIGPTALAVGTTGLWVATQDRRDDPAYLLRYTRTGEYLSEMPIANGVADMVHGAGADVDGDRGHAHASGATARTAGSRVVDLAAVPRTDLACGRRAALGALRGERR